MQERENLGRYIIDGTIVEVTHSRISLMQERGEWHEPQEA